MALTAAYEAGGPTIGWSTTQDTGCPGEVGSQSDVRG
jgi:hypothetical protein